MADKKTVTWASVALALVTGVGEWRARSAAGEVEKQVAVLEAQVAGLEERVLMHDRMLMQRMLRHPVKSMSPAGVVDVMLGGG